MMEINTLILTCRKYFKVNEYYEMDYLHDAFIRVVERIGSNYEEVGKFDSWVRTVAINSIKTGLRRDNINERYFCKLVDSCDFISCNTSVYEVRRKVVLELVVLALGTLPANDYKMVIGKMYGKSCSEIAGELNLNIKTIRKHLTKSYARIKDFVCREYYSRCHEYLENIVF